MIFNDSDPFYIREILVIIAGLLVLSSFSSPLTYQTTMTEKYLKSVSSSFFLIPVGYGAVTAGTFARSLESGSMGYLMTFPVRRGALHIQYALQSVAIFSIMMVIPECILSYLIFDGINFLLILQTLLLLASTMLLFISSGYLVATITRNSAFTALFVLIVFFIMQVYSFRVFPHYIPGRFLMSGFSLFYSYSTIDALVYNGVLLTTVIASVLLLATFPLLKRMGMRSGR